MGSGTSLLILLFALFMVVRALGVVAQALAQAIAALVQAMVTLVLVAVVLLALITGNIGGCEPSGPGDEGLQVVGIGPMRR